MTISEQRKAKGGAKKAASTWTVELVISSIDTCVEGSNTSGEQLLDPA